MTEKAKTIRLYVDFSATIEVEASSMDEAARLVRQCIDGSLANFGAWPNGDPILATVGIFDDGIEIADFD